MDGTNLPLLGRPKCARDGWDTRKKHGEEAAKFITRKAPSSLFRRSFHPKSLTGGWDFWLAGDLSGDRDRPYCRHSYKT